MRPSLSFASSGLIRFAIVMLLAALGTPLDTNIGLSQEDGSPCPESVDHPGIDGEALESVDLPGDTTMWLFKVTLEPEAEIFACHEHEGPFTLSVESGAICYEQGHLATATVIAYAVDVADTGDCAITTSGCVDGCALADGDTVYLPAGSSVSQSAAASHSYGNPHHFQAVVLTAQILPTVEDPPPGCLSGCPKP